MTGLTFSCEMEGENIWPKAYRREMYLATAAFVKAQSSCNMFELLTDVQGQMLNGVYGIFSCLRCGVRIDCEVEHDLDSYGFEFTMKKE